MGFISIHLCFREITANLHISSHQRTENQLNVLEEPQFEVKSSIGHKALIVGRDKSDFTLLFRVIWVGYEFNEWKTELELLLSAPLVLRRYKYDCLMQFLLI